MFETTIQRSENFALTFRLLIMLLIVGVLAACSAVSTQSPPPTQPAVDQPTPTQPSVPVQTPQFSVITISLGIDPNGPYQMLPYFLKTGGGHYLLYVFETKKLIYDGQTVFSGDLAGLGQEAIGVSQNGLHYAYVLPSSQGGNFHDLLIDGNKVNTAEYLAYPEVTDDGQHYFYTACADNGFTGTCLVKDGNSLFAHPQGILDYSISRSGDAYLASLRNIDANNNFVESLVLNGNQIYQGVELAHKQFSPNGQHYAYVSLDQNNNQHLIVDDNEQRSSQALILLQVTDQGSVCTWDSAKSQVVINAKEIPVTHEQIQCALTADASHDVINDGGWTLDGQPIQFPGVAMHDKIWGVEWSGQGWYVYRLVK